MERPLHAYSLEIDSRWTKDSKIDFFSVIGFPRLLGNGVIWNRPCLGFISLNLSNKHISYVYVDSNTTQLNPKQFLEFWRSGVNRHVFG